MASPTPGVLSKLLQDANGNAMTAPFFSHRSPLLQVIEIVPCLADDHWRSEGFFVKVSDSLHAAYVAVYAGDDADLIRSDEIRLGQLVYVRGGFHIEKGCPVPVIRGLHPVPKRRPCFGNPSDLVSSDALIPFTQASPMDNTKKTRKKNGMETKRLSLDSARKSWDQTSPLSLRCDAALLSSPRLRRNTLVLSDKKASPKNKSPLLHLSSDTSVMTPKFVTKTMGEGIKSSSKTAVPAALFKMPISHKTWSDHRILWSEFPSSSTIHMLGKGISSHKNVAFSSAVSSLEEASAAESLLNCLQAYGQLCESSHKLAAGKLVSQFLDLYRVIQSTTMAVRSLLDPKSPVSISSKRSSSHNTSTAKKNARSWVQAAVVCDLARFSLLKETGKQESPAEQEHHYIVIENSFGKGITGNPTKGSKKSSRNLANEGFASPPIKNCFAANRKNVDSKSRLKESERLAEELLVVSRQWFLKYLENALNKGFFSIKREETNGNNTSLLIQLKKVSNWMDELVENRMEISKKIEELRKKLQRFLLDHIEASFVKTRPGS